MTHSHSPRLGTISAACRVIGGDKPISAATYYRGVARGIYPPPMRVGPNISRVDLDKLDTALQALMELRKHRAKQAGLFDETTRSRARATREQAQIKN